MRDRLVAIGIGLVAGTILVACSGKVIAQQQELGYRQVVTIPMGFGSVTTVYEVRPNEHTACYVTSMDISCVKDQPR
jgi:hypothetical protein